MTGTLYHGGIAGLRPGDVLRPSPPHVTDGCPICRARVEGRTLTVGEYRRWLRGLGEAAKPVLAKLEGADDSAPIDPPTERAEVYMTTEYAYACWYAARSGHGDVYRVQPTGPVNRARGDRFVSWSSPAAIVVEVVRRGVFLSRKERRSLEREWKKRDRLLDGREHNEFPGVS